MASQFSYQLCLALWLGCLQTVQLKVLLPFSPQDPVLMFSSQQTQLSGPQPAPPPVPRSDKTNIFLQPLTKDFPPDTSQRFSQPGAKPAGVFGQHNGHEI